MNLLSSPRSSQLVRNLGWKCLGILGAIGLSQLALTPKANAQAAPTSTLNFNSAPVPAPANLTNTGANISGTGAGTINGGAGTLGTIYRVGDVYRFTNVFTGIDALVTIKDAVGGATLRFLDDNSVFPNRFQPIIGHPGGVGVQAYIQFDVQLVLANTSTPATAINVYFSAQDIDGGGANTVRELVGIKGAQSTVLGNPTTLRPLVSAVPGFVAYEQSDAANTQAGIGIGDQFEFYSFIAASTGNFSIIGGNIVGSAGCGPASDTSIGSCQRQNSYTFDANDVQRLDFGDAPLSYGDAFHGVLPVPTVFLGTGVSGDNGPVYNNTDTLDDGITTFPTLYEKTTSYSLTATCKVNTSFVAGWIDFNRNGTFDPTERAAGTCNGTSVTLNWTGLTGNTAGQSYGRFRISSVAAEVANPTGAAANGEVEDYPITILANADFKLVKRITAINGLTTNPNDNTLMTQVLDNPATANDNPTVNWPSGYLQGTFNTGTVKPGDEIEYTIYYLNAKGANSSTVKICDPIVGNQTYVPSSMRLLPGNVTTPIVLTDIVDPTTDRAQTFAAGTIPIKCGLPATTTNGGVSIEITGTGSTPQPTLLSIPGATGAGLPNTSYGFFRFKTKVKP